MSITLQARQADGTWAVRNAFTTENAKVRSGSMKIEDLEMQARRLMSKWQATIQDGRQLRVHNSANDTASSKRSDEPKTYGAWKITEHEYQIARNLSEGCDALADTAFQLVRYCRGEVFYRDQAEEACRMIREQAAA